MKTAILFCVLLLLRVIGHTVFAEEPKTDLSKAEQQQFEGLAEIFSPPGTPSIKGKKWVEVDFGPANWSSQVLGWLIEDTDSEVVIMNSQGELQRYKKPLSSEKRPDITDDQKVPFAFQKPPVDRSIAWKVQSQDFPAMCQKFIEAGVPKDTFNKDTVFKMINDQVSEEWHVVEAARYAHFAHQAGHSVLSLDLVHEATKTIKLAQQKNYGNRNPPTLLEYVADRIARGYRRQGIAAAERGTPRPELQQIWAKMAAMPYHESREEAKAMVKHYKSLLAEDARWVEPDAAALAKLSTEKQAAYWLYHLRDLDVVQLGSPGVCHVLFDSRFRDVQEPEKKLPHPAIELQKLGRAAIPLLIAHLDDARPTRCETYWRSWSPEGRYLLRYGDCCKQIFEAITEHKISEENYPLRASDGSECKARAEKWWQEEQEKSMKRAK